MPPTPDMYGSPTFRVAAVATAASKALPPSISILTPAIDASGCADATMPLTPIATGLDAGGTGNGIDIDTAPDPIFAARG